jgi:hypothetical protein
MSERYGYVGNNPANSPTVVARQLFEPVGVQTTFTFVSGYQIGYIDVYLNGSKLVEGYDYIASNGQNINLISPATFGDILELVAYKAYSVAYPNTIGNLSVSGSLSANTAYFTNITGTLTGTALTAITAGYATTAGISTISQGLTGSPSVTVTNVSAGGGIIVGAGLTVMQNVDIRGNLVVDGDLTIQGDSTILNTSTLDVEDKIIGIARSATTDAFANQSGISVYGGSDTSIVGPSTTAKTLLWYDNDDAWVFNQKVGLGTDIVKQTVSIGGTLQIKGFVETQVPTSLGFGNVLSLKAGEGTVFTHTTSNNIGIVSFTGISTDRPGATTFTVLMKQGSTPYNVTGGTGIGMQMATVVTQGGVGYSTHIKVGTGSTIVLTNSANALDILTFIVSYDGNPSIANTSFTVVGFAVTDFRGLI